MTKRIALLAFGSLLFPLGAAAGPASTLGGPKPAASTGVPARSPNPALKPASKPQPSAATPAAQPRRTLSPEGAQGGLLLLSDAAGEDEWLAPVVSNDVDFVVTGLIVRADVDQIFVNPSDSAVDATYVFPLPETAAVDGLTFTVGERVIVGEMRERGEARQTFERARREGKKASLIEQERPNLFTANIANIGPGEEVQVRITYQQDVKYDGGTFSFDFPSTLTPRYISGNATGEGFSGSGWGVNTASVPDAERITPPVTLGEDAPTLDLSVTLDAGFPVKAWKASHDMRVVTPPTASTPAPLSLRFAEGPVLANQDFHLEWQAEPGRAPRTAVFEETFKGERYALLMALPPDRALDKDGRLPREAVFVIDTSGSMDGRSIEQARLSLESGLKGLRAGDHFNVIAFNSSAASLFPAPVAVTPSNIATALGWVRGLSADGGTEMLPALQLALGATPVSAALQAVGGAESVRQVVFITDGSVGNEPELFQFIQTHLGKQRLFTVGIGSAPNQYFMRGAARFGRGTFTNVASTEDVAGQMNALWGKLDAPVMSELELGWGGAPALETWPERLPDLYRGEPMVMLAKLGPKTSSARFAGRRASERFSSELALSAGAPSQRERGIHKLWARRKIEGLMDRLIEGQSEESIRPQVTALSLEHHVMSKYASLVAVDKVRSVEGPSRAVTIANVLPAGNTMFGNLPQTASPGPTCLLVSLLSFASAGALGLRWRR